MTLYPNDLSCENLGVVAINPLVRSISAARLAMLCSHIGQALPMEGATVKRLITGIEREYAKDDHNIQFPCNAIIKKVVRKYPRTPADERIKDNPITSIIYENADTDNQEIGVLHLPSYHNMHQHFGFNYVLTSDASRLFPDEYFEKGTVIATSPIVTPDGDYKMGIEAQVAFMSIPTVIEDGIEISDEFAQRCRTKGYGTRTVSWGKNAIPVNLYGDPSKPDEYKPFPDIGEYVHDNGLLFATRSYEDMVTIPLLSRSALRNVDFFDTPVQAIPGAKIIDVIVYKGNRDKTYLPQGMDEQCRYYYRRSISYYQNILEEYYKLRGQRGVNLVTSPAFGNLVVRAEAITKAHEKPYLTPSYGRRPIDEWLVDIVFEYDIVPTIGFKFTGLNGDKGIVCGVRPKADMPVDATGNVADYITDFDSSVKRMNPGRTYEQYINSSGRALALSIEYDLRATPNTAAKINQLWDHLMGFYKLLAPAMYDIISKRTSTFERQLHLECVARDGMYLYLPPDNPVKYIEVINQLRYRYPAPLGPIRYRGNSGRLVTTKNNVLIGGMYILLLEKIGNSWQAVSSAKLQHFGIPAKLTNADKYAAPGRHNPVRIFGESEVRLVSAICGGDIVADILDQANNPVAHRSITETILRSDTATNIERIIDRNKIPAGNGRIITLVRHVLECAGIRFTRGKRNAV